MTNPPKELYTITMEQPKPRSGFNVFSFSDEITVNRIGKKVNIKGSDGSFTDSDSVEANLLFEILKVLKKSK